MREARLPANKPRGFTLDFLIHGEANTEARHSREPSLGISWRHIERLEHMTQTKVFLNNRTQAVRLPKAVAFPEDVKVVDVRVVGNARVVTPVGKDWEYWVSQGTVPTDDFMISRDQPPMQTRSWDH